MLELLKLYNVSLQPKDLKNSNFKFSEKAKNALSEAVNNLPDSEKTVVKSIHGLDGHKKLIEEELAKVMLITTDEVSEIYTNAMRLMRIHLTES